MKRETFWWHHYVHGFCEWKGYRVEMDGLTFFIARGYGDIPSRDWYVTEARSGYSITPGAYPTIAEAERALKQALRKRGRDTFLRRIRAAIREHGESPWRAAEKARRKAA